MVRVKICGITNLEDALYAAEQGADALGFLFHPESPRCMKPSQVREIISHLPPYVVTVGVFGDETEEVLRAAASEAGVDRVQLHGREPAIWTDLGRPVIKTIRVRGRESLVEMERYAGKVEAFLLDTYREETAGGTGAAFDWTLCEEAKGCGPLILAGGLTPENVGEAVRTVRPYAVDVSSGVEASLGRKDPGKVERFIRNAKGMR
jgi:phosphoribosylanthranilate isomerase